MHPSTPNCRGLAFSLVEIVAILIVLVVLAAVVAGVANTSRLSLETEAAALGSNLRFAQTRAMAATEAVWSVQITEAGYSLLRDGVLADQPWPDETSATHLFPDTVRATAGTGTITYNAWGNPGTDDWTITLAKGTESLSITVIGVTGFVR